MAESCLVHAQRTTVSLYAALRGRCWLEDGLQWLVDDVGKNMDWSVQVKFGYGVDFHVIPFSNGMKQ